jgi:DNA replication ATP-dependent helicase Dna2
VITRGNLENLAATEASLRAYGLRLNPTQWDAWRESLSRRHQLVWGPPGTGKSLTAQAIVLGAALDAYQRGLPLRILICAATYNAMDNVFLPALEDLQGLLPSTAFAAFRVRSAAQPPEAAVPNGIECELRRGQPSPQVQQLWTRLDTSDGITLVGTTPQQTVNLVQVNDGPARHELFDLIVIDEASQMDVAHGILALSCVPLAAPPVRIDEARRGRFGAEQRLPLGSPVQVRGPAGGLGYWQWIEQAQFQIGRKAR